MITEACLDVNYGIDTADFKPVQWSRRVSTMPGFPFAHLIFPLDEPEYLVYFLGRMGDQLGHTFADNNYEVPHIFCQNQRGVFVVPFKNVKENGIGAGDPAGMMLYGDKDQFGKVTYETCIANLAERLPLKSDLNLANLL